MAGRLVSPVLFIGLDVHKDSIAASLAPSDSTEVRRYGVLDGTTSWTPQRLKSRPLL